MDIALILWNPDVIEWVSIVLRQENLKCCGMEPSAGPQKIEELITACGSRVVMLDLAPPYEQSADILLRLLERFPGRLFVLSCADPMLAMKAAPWLSAHVLLQKPYELEVIRKVLVSMVSRISRCYTAASTSTTHMTAITTACGRIHVALPEAS